MEYFVSNKCKFCGEVPTLIQHGSGTKKTYTIKCKNCGSTTRYNLSIDSAISEWNIANVDPYGNVLDALTLAGMECVKISFYIDSNNIYHGLATFFDGSEAKSIRLVDKGESNCAVKSIRAADTSVSLCAVRLRNNCVEYLISNGLKQPQHTKYLLKEGSSPR